ncbi:MAG: TlpA family protein disulfide reductase [Deltaproteobacteria bacterium]|nr:TlpA family protein disulfide reductase [Deltaproteobacteria bacterium]
MTAKFLLRITVAILAVGFLLPSGCNCSGQDGQANVTSRRAPHFTLQDIKGNTVRLKDLRGKVVLLNFFATWCGPCRQETPDFIRLYKKFNAKGFEIIGVGLDMQGAAALAPFAQHFRIPYPIVVGTRQVVVDYGNIKAVPESFFIDRNGYIVKHLIGMRPVRELEETIVRLLEQKA